MKYSFLACILFFAITATAQESILLKGSIEAQDLEGTSINIINTNLRTGTTSSRNGDFEIRVREGDTLLFSSILYENLKMEITSKIYNNEFLSVSLKEDVNELATVNLNNYHLTGNLAVDSEAMETYSFPVLSWKFEDVKNARFDSDINDTQSKPTNIALGESTQVDGSINIFNLLAAAIDLTGIAGKSVETVAPMPRSNPSEMRKLYGDVFFTETLQIDYDYINDFIFYAYDNGLGALVQENKNDLELIEFFMLQSKNYRKLKEQN